MNRFDHQWQKLTALARQAEDARDIAAPYGFATRVAALAPAPASGLVFERFALRGLAVAAAFGLGALAFSFTTTQAETGDETGVTDAVAALLDLS